jgi:hypothetical protein
VRRGEVPVAAVDTEHDQGRLPQVEAHLASFVTLVAHLEQLHLLGTQHASKRDTVSVTDMGLTFVTMSAVPAAADLAGLTASAREQRR